MKKPITYILLTLTTILSLGFTTAYADREFTPPTIAQPQTLPGKGVDTRDDLITKVLPRYAVGLIGFVAMAALVFVIIGGVRFATAYGNEEAVETAKKQIIYSLLALVVALLSYTIVSIIVNLQFEGNATPSPAAAPPATAPPAASPSP